MLPDELDSCHFLYKENGVKKGIEVRPNLNFNYYSILLKTKKGIEEEIKVSAVTIKGLSILNKISTLLFEEHEKENLIILETI